jgi:epidermal growth factor receptor kinase substrate 8
MTEVGGMSLYDQQQHQPLLHEPSPMIRKLNFIFFSEKWFFFCCCKDPSYAVGSQHTSRTINQQHSTMFSTEHYKNLTDELNKCFDDIELFVRYLESLMEYTKELERDYRRKDKKSTGLFIKISFIIIIIFFSLLAGLKQMIEKLPDDQFFIDILQKFKHSFNLLGELKHVIHNPNAAELTHYLLSPLQFIVHTLRRKHTNQLQLAQDVWTPALTKEARELLVNCLTSKEHEILRNLGPAWIRTT